MTMTEDFPERMTPDAVGGERVTDLAHSLVEQRASFSERLTRAGAVLLRGFAVNDAADFAHVCAGLGGELLNYAGGESPRTAVADRVYTSTEYPSHLAIPLHNEMSYAKHWPRTLFFFCESAPLSGGATPLADSREILARVPAEVVARFRERGVMYTQNLHGGWGLGKSWQETFETDDPARVAAFCMEADISYSWSDNGLSTRAVRPAMMLHPLTGEEVWFNQADLWHISSRGADKQRALLKVMSEAELPRNAYYGDGSRIAAEDMETVREVYRACERSFAWCRGDVLVVDNLLMAHGRQPYTGPRRILVAMS